jgi:hypothetical protein
MSLGYGQVCTRLEFIQREEVKEESCSDFRGSGQLPNERFLCSMGIE